MPEKMRTAGHRTQTKAGAPLRLALERLGGDGVSRAPERAPAFKPAWGANGRAAIARDADPYAHVASVVIAIRRRVRGLRRCAGRYSGWRMTGCFAAAASSSRRTGVVYGALRATDGSSAASRRISAIA